MDTYIHKKSSLAHIRNFVSTDTHQHGSNPYHGNHNLICMCNLKNYVIPYYKGFNCFLPFLLSTLLLDKNSKIAYLHLQVQFKQNLLFTERPQQSPPS